MSRLLTAAQIAAGALRRIGALSPRDEGPDPDELDIALHHLDLLVGELAGTMRTFWLVKSEVTFALAPATRSYNLKVALGANYPEDGLQFPISAWLLYPQTDPTVPVRRKPLEIIRRLAYQAKTARDQPGEPCEVYIDRLDPPTLAIYPVIALTGYSVALHYQTYSGDLLDGDGNRPHGLPAAWQRWCEIATAAEIGDGPVRRLAPARLTRLSQLAALAKRDLEYSNREHAPTRRVAYRDV